MKKILIVFLSVITIVSLSGCSNDINYKKEIDKMVSEEIHKYMFNISFDNDYNIMYDKNNNIVYTNEINSDMAASILLLDGYMTLNLDLIFSKVDKTVEEVTTYYENKEIYSISDVFNMVLVYNVLDLDLTKLEDYCTELTYEDLGYYDYITAIKCLNLLEVNTELKEELFNIYLDFNNQSYIDADVASMIVVAFQGDAPKEYVDYLFSIIQTNGYVDGFGDIPCSSSIAQVALALISEGYHYSNNIVTNALFDFKSDGGFKNKLEDEEVELSFASPQSFKAIVATYLYEDTGKKIVLY